MANLIQCEKLMAKFNMENENTKKKYKTPQLGSKPTEVIIKTEILSCFCCRGVYCLRDLDQTYFNDGKLEVYSELLFYCYGTQIMQDLREASSSHQKMLCERCAQQLRAASTFRQQVEQAIIHLKTVLETSTVNLESDTVNDYNSENDIPIAILARKKRKTRSTKVANLTIADSPSCSEECAIKTENEELIIEPKVLKKTSPRSNKTKNSLESDPEWDFSEEHFRVTSTTKKKWKDEKMPYRLETTDLKCKICGEVFVRHYDLQKHMPVHFPNHICEQCGRPFATRKQLLVHSTVHNEAKYICTKCPERCFKTAVACRTHERRMHMGEKRNYKCPHCSECFTNHQLRTHHLQNKHSYEKRIHRCLKCPATFSSSGGTAAHVRRVHLNERKHACSTCGKAFFHKLSLKNHMIVHTDIKPHACKLCDFKCRDIASLNLHILKHTGEIPFACQKCGYKCKQKRSLLRHMKLVHLEGKKKGQESVS